MFFSVYLNHVRSAIIAYHYHKYRFWCAVDARKAIYARPGLHSFGEKHKLKISYSQQTTIQSCSNTCKDKNDESWATCSELSLSQPKQTYLFSIWVFFHKHSRFTGQQGKGEAISLHPLCHFQPLHLDISRAIIVESSPLHITSIRTRTWNLCFQSASRKQVVQYFFKRKYFRS